MKKLTAILLAVTLILALAACGSATGSSQGSTGANPDTSAAQDNGTGMDSGTASSGAPAWSAQGTEQGEAGGLGIVSTDGTGNDVETGTDVTAAGTENAAQAATDAIAAGTESAAQAATDAAASGTESAAQAATDAAASGTESAAQAATDASASGTWDTAVAAESAISPDKLLSAVKGSYDELFTVICDLKYDQLWLDRCQAIVGKEKAPECVEMLKNAFTGTIYGKEAEEAYEEDPEQGRFDSYFHEGVKRFVFEGNRITGLDEDGEEVFSHEYTYLQDFDNPGELIGYVYETSDRHAGQFKYFLLPENTPEKDYHIEFRYGSDLDDLTKLDKGDYAYWLAGAKL